MAELDTDHNGVVSKGEATEFWNKVVHTLETSRIDFAEWIRYFASLEEQVSVCILYPYLCVHLVTDFSTLRS